MLLAKVKGNLVSTQKNSNLKGHKLLLTHQIDLEGNLVGNKDIIALDLTDAGIGDTVLVAQEGGAVRQILQSKKVPAHSIIVAVVDKLEVKENSIHY